MLTADLVKARLRPNGARLEVVWLPANDLWRATAADLIGLLQACVGRPQEDWQEAVTEFCGSRLDYMEIRGLAKVLSDAAVFEPPTAAIEPSELRRLAFAEGPAYERPSLVKQETRAARLERIAAEFATTKAAVEAALYADRGAAAILTDVGVTWTAESLIGRYNLELARAALYWADEMTIRIFDTFKDFWRYLKLFKLMFWATEIEADGRVGYEVALDGPISPFVQATTRYGRQMAAFLPALFLAERWEMTASVRQFGRQLTFLLDNTTALKSHFKGSGNFDSKLEADFAAEFAAKFGDERQGWVLTREPEVVLLGDTVLIPDFAAENRKDGRRALIELVGFWHPNYLRRKLEKVEAAARDDLILVVYSGLNITPEALAALPAQVVMFKNKPVLKEVLAALERVAR